VYYITLLISIINDVCPPSSESSVEAGDCSHGQMRLLDPVDDQIAMRGTGVVQVCINNVWGGVCVSGFRAPEADVVCNNEPGFTGIGL